ncbi:MAG: ATP-grasp domain-containing protein [Fibrobacterales bacterium]
MGKTLLIISASVDTIPGIVKAKSMGLYVVVSDMNSEAPGIAYADDFICASTYHAEETAEKAYAYSQNVRNIDGVICIGADVPYTVAVTAAKLDLPSISIQSALLASNKIKMKDALKAKAIPIPWYREIDSAMALEKELTVRRTLIVKPVDSRGARGVLKLHSGDDCEWAYQEALSYSPSNKVMIEEYLEGPQVSTEAIIVNGVGYTVGFADRNYEYLERFAPFIIENGGTMPSVLSIADQHSMSSVAIEAGLALGIENGIVKGDMVLTIGGAKVIEVAARLSGGNFCTDQIPLGTGVDLVGNAIKQVLGESITISELTPQFQRSVAIRYFLPENGTINQISGVKAVQERPSTYSVNMFLTEGDVVGSVSNHTTRAGYVICFAETREEVLREIDSAISSITISVDPR